MRVETICVWLMAMSLGLVRTALGHPGHGMTDPNAVSHYVTEPIHAAPVLVIGAAAAVGISLLAARRRRSR